MWKSKSEPAEQKTYAVEKSDSEWREQLSPAEYDVLRRAGTERPHTGEYDQTWTEGVYRCKACNAELFRSETKFDAHCGWPSFWSPLAEDRVDFIEDSTLGMKRVEVRCANCGSHLGPRLRRRLRHTHRAALLHQLHLPDPGAVRGLSPVARPAEATVLPAGQLPPLWVEGVACVQHARYGDVRTQLARVEPHQLLPLRQQHDQRGTAARVLRGRGEEQVGLDCAGVVVGVGVVDGHRRAEVTQPGGDREGR